MKKPFAAGHVAEHAGAPNQHTLVLIGSRLSRRTVMTAPIVIGPDQFADLASRPNHRASQPRCKDQDGWSLCRQLKLNGERDE
jgi:hypothetical protein